MIAINDIVAASHFFVARHVRPGDTVVDATAGNGHDTLFLAKLTGPGGRVHAFDIQKKALANTRALLEKNGLEQRVSLHLDSHKNMPVHVSGPVRAIMFNLGYLPGGDQELVTVPDDTVAALSGSLGVLAKGGIISVATYSGHQGGSQEEEAVAAWCNGLSPREYTVMKLRVLNKENNPPMLWLIKG
ncbi:MAG TPA: hypothetical protein DG577_07380 [Firmicutes bacterium]|mgnify:FL=1|jgi:hypothetical protein|nr:hypothetical protein [Bacillota bacterium]HCX79218.1 hypothetical protein [Bacillota bacterium]